MAIFDSYVIVYQIVIYLLKILIFHSDVNVYQGNIPSPVELD